MSSPEDQGPVNGIALGLCKSSETHGRFRSPGPIVLKRVLSMCFLVLGLSSSASIVLGQREVDPMALVPRTAVAVSKINWTFVRRDDRFRAMLNADLLDRALSQLKINGSDVSEVVVFSGINISPTGVVGGIFCGSFDLPAVSSALKSQDASEQMYRGQTIYCNQADRSCATILGSGVLVVGSQKAVEGVIEVAWNPRTSLTSRPPFSSLLRRFVAGRQPISFAMALPLEYQMVAEVGAKVVAAVFNLSGLGPLGFVIDTIGFPQAIGFALTRKGNTFPTELIARMKDESSAALISGTLNLAQAINLDMLSNRMPQTDREMLKNMSLTRNGSLLSISMILREQDLPPLRSQ